jgi:hypothetical protein
MGVGLEHGSDVSFANVWSSTAYRVMFTEGFETEVTLSDVFKRPKPKNILEEV